MRKRLVLLQALAILIAVFQYGMRATGQDEGIASSRIRFYPYLTARIPLGGSGVDEWLATAGQRNSACVHVHRRRIYRRYQRMSLWMMLSHILIGILYTGNRKARSIWFYCTDKVCHYQLYLKSVLFYTLMEYGALVNEMLLMMSGDIESNPGPSTALTLKTVFNALHSVCHKWFSIGLQLDVPKSRLNIIETDRPGAEERMRTMLEYWLDNATELHQSWQFLVDALKAPAVGQSRLARELEEKYCSPEDQNSLADVESSVNPSKAMQEERLMSHAGSTLGDELTAESSTTSAETQSSSTICPSSKGSEKSPFGCGCGKCTFFTFMVTGCQKPTPSVSSFPYLDPSEVTPEQQQALRGRLRTESRRINMQFQYLVSTTLTSLKNRHVTVCDFLPHLMTFGTDEPVLKDSQAPVFDQRLNDLQKAGDLSEVFMGLKDYMSFFNYHLIEHIINVLGTEEDKAELKKYKTNFQQYAKRRVYECPPQFGPVSEAGHADIFVKIDSRYENYTLAEIEDFSQELSNLLGLSSKGVLRLCWVQKGCFQLTFQIPLFVKEEIFPLSSEQERTLAAEGVIRLTCGKYQFQKEEPSQPGVDKKSQHDDDDSGVGPSISATKSTTVSEAPLDRELKELDYELRVQGLVETASSNEHWSRSGLELHLAVLTRKLEDVKFLVEENNCNPMQNHQGINAVHMAALHGKLEVFKYFITERNCSPACPGPLGFTPLHMASEQGHFDIVRYLVIEQQMDPLCEDEYGNTALHRACVDGCQAVVKLIAAELEKYNPITQVISGLKNKWHSTPLHAAVLNGHLDIVKSFISDQKCDPNISGQYGGTPLHYAADRGHLHIIKYLTDEQGCNPSCLDDQNRTPLHRAAAEGHMDIVKFLTVEKHCDPMCRDSEQNTPLHFATWNGHIDINKFLTFEMHCNPMSRNVHNATSLHIAAKKGHLDIVQFFIDQNCDSNIPGQNGGSPLHYAAEDGHLHVVKYLTDEQGCNPSCLDDLNRTPLHLAAMKGHMDIVKFLTVEKQCDPMCKDSDQNTPLHIAAQNGHIDVVKFLTLEMHCDPMCRNSNQNTTLHLAAHNGHIDVVKLLTLEMHCDPTSRNALTDTPLHLAAVNGHLDIVRFLTSDRNCDPNIPGQYGGTALHYAAESSHLDIVKYLTDEQECNPSGLDDLNRTPLHWAAMKGHVDIVKFLTVEKHCNPTCRDSNKVSPLHEAAQNGHIDVVKFLTLEMHCDPTSRSAKHHTALHLAAAQGHLDIVQFFISDQRIDPNISGQYGGTPLHYAAEFGHLHIVKYFTDECSCNPSCTNRLNRTPLCQAAMNGHLHIVKFLSVEKHCDTVVRDSQQNTPLHLAVFNGHLDILQFFISDQKIDPNIPGEHGSTPLHYAAFFGHLHIVKYLTGEKDCNPSYLDDMKATPLHDAATKGHIDIVKFLTVKNYCDPMSRNISNDTPLHFAVREGHLKVVSFFIEELKCPPDIMGQRNKTPYEMAIMSRHPDIAQYLQRHSVIPYIFIAIDMMKTVNSGSRQAEIAHTCDTS